MCIIYALCGKSKTFWLNLFGWGQAIAVPICVLIRILKHAFLLWGQSILVCLAWIATEIAFGIAAVHGMMFGQSVRLLDVGSIETVVATSNFYLSGNGIVILLPSTTHFGFVLLSAHW